MFFAAPHAIPKQIQPISISWKFYARFCLCAMLMFPLHEFSHYLAFRMLGVNVRPTLNTASPRRSWQRKPMSEPAGPLLNLALAGWCAVAARKLNRLPACFAALALASSTMRLVIYVLVLGAALVTGSGLKLGNDEPIAADLWRLPSLVLVGVLAVPFLVIISLVMRQFAGQSRSRASKEAGATRLYTCSVLAAPCCC
jgi:hypothetical protein